MDNSATSDIVPKSSASSAVARVTPRYKSNIPAPAPQTILEEDDYIDAISKIIERDFFPNIAKLKKQHAYLDAVESNDIERIAAAARDLTGNKTPFDPRRLQTPSQTPRFARAGVPDEAWTPARVDIGSATPTWGSGDRALERPRSTVGTPAFETPVGSTSKKKRVNNGDIDDAANETIDTSLSLDQFQARYTSEDNASFMEIIEKINKRRRDQFNWMYDRDSRSLKLVEKGSASDQKLLKSGSEGDDDTVASSTDAKAKNSLMYFPEGLGTNLDQSLIRGNPKEIVHSNTSFQGHDLLVVNKTAAAKVNPAPYLAGKQEATPRIAGYSLVSSTPTPSMSQMEDDPEMMTWGTIEDEPLLISSGVEASSPSPFRLPPTSRRELIAQKLSEKASKSFREKSTLRAKVFATPSTSALAEYASTLGPGTPTPRFNSPYAVTSSTPLRKGSTSVRGERIGSPNPRVRTEMLSPAAKSLLNRASSSTRHRADQQLRSSYGINSGSGSSSSKFNGPPTPSPLDDLPPQCRIFFRSPQSILSETVDALKFQDEHMKTLVNYLKDRASRQRQILLRARDEVLNVKAMKR
ncbi:DiGeorge syndrome critical region protein 14 [Lunasporangiospora selenospora]|uniref:DiGeorge syndrome critical region protein 14 n=1 Tax=Lunasporangiospora selenospora TaxID=979761 RepID=A0A9P6FVQ4_9FUNG|nr:DiGeorge syndrome critical region protein 14 [Lunasporangiospora selenospora]